MDAKLFEEQMGETQKHLVATAQHVGYLRDGLLKMSADPRAQLAASKLEPLLDTLIKAQQQFVAVPSSIAEPPAPVLARGTVVRIKPEHLQRYAVSLGVAPGVNPELSVVSIDGPMVRAARPTGGDPVMLLVAHIDLLPVPAAC